MLFLVVVPSPGGPSSNLLDLLHTLASRYKPAKHQGLPVGFVWTEMTDVTRKMANLFVLGCSRCFQKILVPILLLKNFFVVGCLPFEGISSSPSVSPLLSKRWRPVQAASMGSSLHVFRLQNWWFNLFPH